MSYKFYKTHRAFLVESTIEYMIINKIDGTANIYPKWYPNFVKDSILPLCEGIQEIDEDELGAYGNKVCDLNEHNRYKKYKDFLMAPN